MMKCKKKKKKEKWTQGFFCKTVWLRYNQHVVSGINLKYTAW